MLAEDTRVTPKLQFIVRPVHRGRAQGRVALGRGHGASAASRATVVVGVGMGEARMRAENRSGPRVGHGVEAGLRPVG